MLNELAREAGIADSYTDYFGREKIVSRETKRTILAAMGLEAHSDRQAARLARELRARRVKASRNAPRAGEAYIPLAAERIWGYTLQLYSMRSPTNWGMGDLGDLARFAQTARAAGADLIGLNPLHQLRLIDPSAASPYAPLSRKHLNVLYIDVDAAWSDLIGEAPAFDAAVMERVRRTDLVDYDGVAALKMPALRALYDRWTSLPDPANASAFARFRAEGGTALRQTAVFEALNAHFRADNPRSHGWMQWPAAYSRPASPHVAKFARAHATEIEFYEFLQWIADTQLGTAAMAATGMAIGLYRDLAIGVDANGADVWCERDAYCMGLSVGAPPDELNTEGQDWGLPPLNPHDLPARRYEPFLSVLRANMRHAGALRIDHVMGLRRLFLIPHGAPAAEGAYVAYPFEDLLALLAAESRSSRCMIVGEDLGTVPSGFRERMAQARVLSCRLLYFEDPDAFPRNAVASTGTHDLPPLLGEWARLSPERRRALCTWAGSEPPQAGRECSFVTATYRALARCAARVLLVQMEDALLAREPVNVPGTTTQQPNWRRKLPVSLEALKSDDCFTAVAGAVSNTRLREKEER